MITKCTNGRHLVICEKDTVQTTLPSTWVPCVVLLTAWSIHKTSVQFWKDTVNFLLDKGAIYFVCIGSFSEQLHDEIDESIYQYYDVQEIDRSINIITTFHSDETIDEAVSFFVYTTELHDKINGCLLAILDFNTSEDREVKTYLEKA